MKKKLQDILENHVDKLIVGILAILSLGILWAFVLSNPYSAKFGSRKLSPGEVDKQIAQRAESLRTRIEGEPTIETKVYTDNSAMQFAAAMESTVKLNEDLNIPIPNKKTVVKQDSRSYEIPSLPEPENITAEAIRTAVFMPTQEVNSERTYADADTEVADIDLVSVQVSFDTSKLYDKFEKSFAGESVPAIYRDEELADPVFAAVRLERQRLLDNGEWSDWQKVGPTRINSRKELFDVPSNISEIELGGIDLFLLNFDKFDIMADLLQPLPYDFAASNEEWLAPEYHKELAKLREKQAEEEERLNRRGGRDPRTRREAIRPTARDDRFGGRRPGRLAEREETEERTEDDIYEDQEFMTLTEDLELGKLKEPIFIWAHDDNVKPENTYRYRMRIGVFNPIAGKNWAAESDSEYNDDIILWTDYSEPSEEIKIDPTMYIFPVDLNQRPIAASIQVSKFLKGKWRSRTFEVRKDEEIGEKVLAEEEEESAYGARTRRRRGEEEEEPKYLDFRTGATLVDIINKGRPGPGQSPIFEVKYTFDNENFITMPVKKRNWPDELADKYEDIEKAKEVEVTIYDSRGQSGRRRSRPNEIYPDEMEMMEMEMMMMEGMQPRR